MNEAEGGCQMPDTGCSMPKPAVVQVDFKAPQTGLGPVAGEMAAAALAQGG